MGVKCQRGESIRVYMELRKGRREEGGYTMELFVVGCFGFAASLCQTLAMALLGSSLCFVQQLLLLLLLLFVRPAEAFLERGGRE